MSGLLELSNPHIQRLNASQHLLTRQIEKTVSELLSVSVATGVIGKKFTGDGPLGGGWPIEITSKSEIVEFRFPNFVSYAVTSETYAQNHSDEECEGGWIRVYSKSFFLDFVAWSTWASSDYPGKLVHYQVNTLDHTIDVVTSQPPELNISKGSV